MDNPINKVCITLNTNLQMLFDYLYKSQSVGDLGTLYQLKTRLNRKDVCDKVNKSYHGCEAFFNSVVDGYIVYAAMVFFGMASPNSTPNSNQLEPGATSQTQLFDAVEKLVEKYVLLEAQPAAVLFTDIQQSEHPQIFTCRYPDCNREYQHEKRRNNHEVTVHGLKITNHEQNERSPPDPRNEDGIFNYSHNIVKTGLLFKDFQDAIKEGDGGRVEYLWKFMMLLFKVSGKTKYALAAVRLHAQLHALLTPKEARSLRWNRTVNLKGGVGRNIAIDQAMEHCVRDTKQLMYGQGANLSFKVAQTYSRASDDVKSIMNNFDQTTNVRRESTKHKRGEDSDITTIVNILKEIEAFCEVPGRTHSNVGSIPKDPISVLDFADLNAWLTKHKKNWVNSV